jgi:hypothetical protein
VVHSFEETLRCYEDASQNFKLLPSIEKIIENVLKEVNLLIYIFDQCYSDIEKHRGDELFGFGAADDIQRFYFARVRDEIELLKKCKHYKKSSKQRLSPFCERS